MSEPAAPERPRLFVAVELPPAWQQALEQAQTDLRRLLQPELSLRWVQPEGIHLTLKFLGSVNSDRVDGLMAALQDCVAMPSLPELRLAGLGWFASRGSARVLWAGIAGEVESLALLASQIDRACADLGFTTEPRPLAPHLTLARVPQTARLPVSSLRTRLDGLSLPDLPVLRVQEVSLMRSHLGHGRARYEWIEAFTVGVPPPLQA